MKNKRLKVIFTCLFVFCLSTPVQAATKQNSTNQIISETNTVNKSDYVKISGYLNNVLSYNYELMKNPEFNTENYLVKNKELSDLLDTEHTFKRNWYKKVGLKIKDYKSSLEILNTKILSPNNYLLDVSYYITFTNSNDVISESKETYRFEMVYEDNNWYITKMLNLNEDIDISNTNVNRAVSTITSSQDYFPEYEEIIENKLIQTKNITENMDDYYAEYSESISSSLESQKMSALSYSGYNRNNAGYYANMWALYYNPAYNQYSNDCQNFVSQVVNAGGVPTTSCWANGTTNWINVNSFYSYITSNGYTTGGTNSINAKVADVIQFYNSGQGTYSHSAVLTKLDSSGWYYSAHSSARKNYPLSNVYPSSTYTSLRYIKFW